MMSANKSLKKKNFPSGWKCYKTIGSGVSCAFVEIWSTWEVWRALKKLGLLLATPRATLAHLSCSPNFPRASYLDESMLTYEPIVKLHNTTENFVMFNSNPFTPKISLVILLTVCHTVTLMWIQRIWCWISYLSLYWYFPK